MKFRKNQFNEGFITKKSLSEYRKSGTLTTFDIPEHWDVDPVDYITNDGTQFKVFN